MNQKALFSGRYESIRTLSAQTHRTVSLARAANTGNQVSITRFDKSSLSAAALMRFNYEVTLLCDIECNALAKILDHGVDDEHAYCVWKWIEGQTLEERLRDGPLETSAAIRLALRVLEALECLHDKDLVHLSVRPSKIVFPSDGDPVLLGFGFQAETISSADETLNFLESATYCSPEQTGVLDYDLSAASDLYSVGMVLFACLTGSKPASGNLSDILYKTATWSVPDLRSLNPNVPRAIDQIVQRLLEKQPSQRYQSAAGVAHDLQQVATELAAGVSDPVVPIGQFDNRSTLTQPTFVGREDELDKVEAHLSCVAVGESRCLCVDAESGVGKSRFLQEIVGISRQCGFWVLRGQSSRDEGLRPFAAIANVLDEVVFAISHDEAFQAKLKSELVEYENEICTALPALAEVFDWSGTKLSGPEELGEGRVVEAILRLFEAVARVKDRIAIILDDVQWIDELSLKFVERWTERLENIGGVLLVIAMRPDEGNSTSVRRRAVADESITLRALEESEIKQLLESMAGKLPKQAVDLCVAASDGNAFMASAILHGLVETNALIATETGWTLESDALENAQSSKAAGELLALRLQNLPEKTRNTLSVAAVLGKTFELDVLAHISELTFGDLIEQLGQARRTNLIWRSVDGITFSFSHDKIREGLLAEMNADQRSKWHIKCAELFCETAPDRVFDIAFHFDAANASEKALVYAMQAAREARSRYALNVAREQYEIALRGSRDLSHQAKFGILSGLGDVLLLMGDYDSANDCLTDAMTYAGNQGESARVQAKLGELAFKLGDKATAVVFHESTLRSLGVKVPKNPISLALRLTSQIGTQILHTYFPDKFVGKNPCEMTFEKRLGCETLNQLAYAYYYVRGPAAVLWTHLTSLNNLEKHKPSRDLALTYAMHAPGISLLCLHSRADRYALKSYELHKQMGNRWGMGNCRGFHAASLYSAAQYHDCLDKAREGIQLLQRSGDLWEIGTTRYQAAASLYRLGRLDEAISEAQQIYETGVKIGDHQAICVSLDILSRARLGNIPQTLTQPELGREVKDVQARSQLVVGEAVRLIRLKKYSDAAELLEEAGGLVRKSRIRNIFTAPVVTWLATARRLQLEEQLKFTSHGSRKLRRKAFWTARLAVLSAKLYRTELPHAHRELGLLHIRFGNIRRGIRHLDRSIRAATEQGAQFELALSQKARAEVGVQLGHDRANEELQDATDRINKMQPTSSGETANSNISLLDRFDTLLNSGRQISSALTSDAVHVKTREAALRLLRGEYCVVLATTGDEVGFEPISGDIDSEIISELIEASLSSERTTTLSELSDKANSESTKSAICLPIFVRGHLTNLVYVSHSQIPKLFGENEKRLADYLSAAAAVALENADGFEQLQQLNENLELVVAERTEALERRANELASANSELELTAADLELAKTELESAKNEAESANSAKSSFLAHMSHEIRTPMNAILGFTELLQNNMAESENDRVDYLNTIHSSGRHLLELINDVLDISKIEAGKMETESTECSPFKIISNTLSTFRLAALEKNLALSLFVPGEIPAVILSDPTRFRQIITNLVSNAVKFTEVGSVKLTLRFDVESNLLDVEVSDTGIGLTPEQQQKIFMPFTQADGSITRRFGGTGLGLSISQKLAELLGGGLRVDSEPGKGTTFTMSIDAGALEHELLSHRDLSGPSDPLAEESVSTVASPGTKLLVVDDAEPNRKLISLYLRRIGVHVTTARNGAEAVALASKNDFDAILLDMQMPIMDGYTAAAEIRKNGYEQPVIALTANAMSSDERKCLDAGCTAFLSKPISMTDLLAALSRLVPEQFYESDEDVSSRPPIVDESEDEQDNDAIIDSIAEMSREIEAVVAAESVVEPERTLNDDALIPSLPIDDSDMFEIVQSFVTKLDKRLVDMEDAFADADYPKLAADAHWLKGVGGTVGFAAFTAPAQTLVDEANLGDSPQRMRIVLDELKDLASRIYIPEPATV